MLLEGHGQESGCCLIQEPAEFPGVGLHEGGRERAVLLVLQNALCEEHMLVRPGCMPGAPQSSQAPGDYPLLLSRCDAGLPAVPASNSQQGQGLPC